MAEKSSSADIHRRLSHPVIDADGHWIEFEPTLLEYIDSVAGPMMVDRFRREDYLAGAGSSSRMAIVERRARRITQHAWWGLPTRNSLDRATAMLPRLRLRTAGRDGGRFRHRLPRPRTIFPGIRDHELQLGAYRAYNMMAADLFRGLGDRLISAAVIPIHTPAEAILRSSILRPGWGSKR